MSKKKLLITSMIAFGIFSSAEGMYGLPKLNLTTRNTNSVSQFSTVSQSASITDARNALEIGMGTNENEPIENEIKISREEFEKATIATFKKGLNHYLDIVFDDMDGANGDEQKMMKILVEAFKNLKKCLETNDPQQRQAIISEYRDFIFDVRRNGFFRKITSIPFGDTVIINAFAKAGLDPFGGLGNELALSSPDNYCVFIASRYFETIEDHINLARTSSRFKCNTEKFHYNPISVDGQTVKLFPNVETLHIYNENDQYVNGGRIQQYVDWSEYSLIEVPSIRCEKRELGFEHIEFKNVKGNSEFFCDLPRSVVQELAEEGIITLGENKNKYETRNIKSIDLVKLGKKYNVRISGLKRGCFNGCHSLEEVTIPSTCYRIEDGIFNTIDLRRTKGGYEDWEENEIPICTERVYGKGLCRSSEKMPKIIANNCKDLCGWQSDNVINIYEAMRHNELFFSRKLTSSIMERLSSFHFAYLAFLHINVPNGITRLDDGCFQNYDILQSITLPSTLKEIGDDCFNYCPYLTTLEIPTTVTKLGRYIFSEKLADTSMEEAFREFVIMERQRWKKDNCEMRFDHVTEMSVRMDILRHDVNYRRRNIGDGIRCITQLKLKSFGCLDFAEPQNMAEFSKKYSELTCHMLFWEYRSSNLIGLEIPTTVTSLNSALLCLRNVSSLTFSSSIEPVHTNKQRPIKILDSCHELKELYIPLYMPGLSYKCSVLNCTNLTAIHDVNNPNNGPVTLTPERNLSQQVAQAVLKLRELVLAKQK